MKKTFIIVILLSIFGSVTAQNELSNVRVQVVDTIVVVTYDLEIKADIEVFISFNNSNNFMGPLKEVSGAVGKGILPEKNKIIIWNVVKEIGYVNYENAVIKLSIADKPLANTKKMLAEQKFGIEMIYVEGGTFTMGCTSEQGSNCYRDEKPAHKVTLDSYYIGKYPITREQWNKIMGTKSNYRYDNYPVKASWNDIQFFIKELNLQTGENYRLPTEAEWEYAARGGNQSKGYKYSGSNQIDEVAYNTCYNVGNKLANELGIYDMSGNVLERCSDLYGSYSASDQTNPTGASRGVARILRGRVKDYRVSNRTHKKDPNNNNAGFRLVLDSEDNKIEKKTIADAENHEKRIQEYKKLANTRWNGHYISIGSSCFLSGYYGAVGLGYEYRYKIIGPNVALGFGYDIFDASYFNANIGIKLYLSNEKAFARNLYFNFLPFSHWWTHNWWIDHSYIIVYGFGLFLGYSPMWQVRENLWIGFNIDGGFKGGYKEMRYYYYHFYYYNYRYPIDGGVDLGFVIKFGGRK